MGRDSAIWQLAVASAAEMAGERFVALAVDGAVNALVVGLDGPALRELAGMSRSARSEDVRDLLQKALTDAGVAHLSADEADLINLRARATHALLGWISVRELASWAYAAIGYEGIAAARNIVALDDELDMVESGVAKPFNPRPIIETFLADSRHLIDRFAATAIPATELADGSETPEWIPADPRVPPVSDWPAEGIVGRIGKGPAQGEYVLVDPVWEQQAGRGPIVGYTLELPRRQLFDADGNHVLDDGAYDDIRPQGEGGFVDLLTTSLDVEWSVDVAVVNQEWSNRR
ncbi:hypothetical protein ACFUTX_05255 [Microbacterium sp. NPDC057407]|uniref:hypothetical protein n=1 Tax=Microbacterium sp. NPDC057407 TaxID=3346120 RepID=UPI00366E4D7A